MPLEVNEPGFLDLQAATVKPLNGQTAATWCQLRVDNLSSELCKFILA